MSEDIIIGLATPGLGPSIGGDEPVTPGLAAPVEPPAPVPELVRFTSEGDLAARRWSRSTPRMSLFARRK